MIAKIPGTKNGYKLGEDATDEELKEVLNKRPDMRSFLTNQKTRQRFGKSMPGRMIFTINNHIGDDEFYINNVH